MESTLTLVCPGYIIIECNHITEHQIFTKIWEKEVTTKIIGFSTYPVYNNRVRSTVLIPKFATSLNKFR